MDGYIYMKWIYERRGDEKREGGREGGREGWREGGRYLRRARHVFFHAGHAIARLNVEAPGVVAHTLAHQGDLGSGPGGREGGREGRNAKDE